MEDHEFGMNQAENQTIHCLIDGYHYSHTGVYDIFSYDLEEEGEQTFPIQIQVNVSFPGTQYHGTGFCQGQVHTVSYRTSARRARVLWNCMNESLAEPVP